MSLGVFGGTFNPIHVAHLRLAEEVRCALELERVLFVPASNPPLKSTGVAPAEHRLAMVQRAISSNSHFSACDLELRREGPSYTVDTLLELRAAHPDDRFWFLLGSDSLRELDLWHDPETLVELASLAVVERPARAEPDESGNLAALLPESLRDRFEPGPQGLVHVTGQEIRRVPFEPLAISSTDIRARRASGRSIRYLVSDPVHEYVDKHALYLEDA